MVRRVVVPVSLLVVGAVAAVLLPAVLVPLSAHLVVVALLGLGAWMSLRRVGAVDLATAAAAGAGALAGIAVAGAGGLPLAVGIAPGAAAGAVVGGLVGALGARAGRVLGALASLAVGVAVVGVLVAFVGTSGTHGVPHLAAGERGDLAVAVVCLALALGLLTHLSSSRLAARASVAARAPHVAASLGRRPAVDAAAGGAVAGAVLGTAGVLGAGIAGQLVPDGHGLVASAGLALAALVGGAAPVGGAVGALVVFGPGALVLGAAPVLVTAAIGLAVLAVRPSGLVRGGPRPALARGPADEPVPAGPGLEVELRDAPLPGGATVSLVVRPGEIVAVAGPNGVGKSTLLAMVAGDVDDHRTVLVGGRTPPRGAVRRARMGIARSWQRAPRLDEADALAVAVDGSGGLATARWAAATLTDGDEDAIADLVRVAARRPRLALLDEPGAAVDPRAVVRYLRGLAGSGTAVLVAEHRPDVLAACDRVVEVGG